VIEDQTLNLIREEERAQVSRVRQQKGFSHGQKLCVAISNRLDTTEEFTLLRRFDLMGYNDTRRPFLGQVKRIQKIESQSRLKEEKSIDALKSELQMPGP
jgi:hypothetical protein